MKVFMSPGIECTFTIEHEKIKLITLEPGSKEGLNWKINPHDSPKLDQLIQQWMEIYLSAQQPAFHLPLDLAKITPFTLQVLYQIQKIPFGQTAAYHDIAGKLHKPLAARAVGQACGRNPFPLVIPCHRILAKEQKLGGFSCGLSIKQFLLRHEKIILSGGSH